ncbi:MAG: sterol desaturase family protein [Proteobacteria bacterium]|nr:sterol desaturase family protein [Pseudomonadota bacterium]MDA1308452.1 sterol desaturase family protein [Pseudomonadota bacterium]
MAEVTADTTTATEEPGKDWQPAVPIAQPPVFVWPPRPIAFVRYLFGYPGYFLPRNLLYMALALVTWLYLTPEIATMKTFQLDWVAWIYGRNLAMLFIVFGGWHFRFYILKGQGTAYKHNKNWPDTKHRRFLFGDQVKDNMFWSAVSGCGIWSAYEVVTLWAFANEVIPTLNWETNPIWFAVLFLIIPLIRDAHFYFIHRLLHVKFLYRHAHYLHHKNVNIGPWSGLSMHPFEHVLYFSGILLHWIVLSHPLHAILHVQATGLTPALGHVGFDKYLLGGKHELTLGQRYFHYLHHKYFECNYGGDGTVPLDKWFGSLHDGTEEGHVLMKERRKQAHGSRR